MSRWIRIILIPLFLTTLAACSFVDARQVELPLLEENLAAAVTETAFALSAVPSPTPTNTLTPTPSPTLTPTYTPTPTATPVIKPANVEIEKIDTWGGGNQAAVNMQHKTFGRLYVIDELIVDTAFKISWSDDNPQTAVLRFRNEDDIVVERTAAVDPERGQVLIDQEENQDDQIIPRHYFTLNTADIIPLTTEIERLATLELSDQDGNIQSQQILFSRNDYDERYTGPLQLGQPQYDQLDLGIDWRSEQYAPRGAFADWLNNQPDLWNRVTIYIEGREPFNWRALQQNDALLHQELAAAEYEDEILFTYLTADGQTQILARDTVPYYTKFEIIHSPSDETQFYTLRAGRDPGVSQEMLQQMGDIVRHMFTNRPNYLHELALKRAVHSVAPGKDILVLPEISILPNDIVEVIVGGKNFGAATGIAILERHEELSASAGYYFENEAPVLGFTLMHEVVHQVQYMIYGSSWSSAVEQYYSSYMALPRFERIPNIAYYESLPWEWDAFITTVWFSQGSQLADRVDPFLDLEVSDTGTTIREHLQRRWGDPLPAYESQ